MNGIILDAPTCHRRKVRVNPIIRNYAGTEEGPYRKYNCPVCTLVGNVRIGITKGTPNCPLCGVALNWGRRPKAGDKVLITDPNPDYGPSERSLDQNEMAVITEDHTGDRQYPYPYKVQGLFSKRERFYPEDAFTLLVEEGDWKEDGHGDR